MPASKPEPTACRSASRASTHQCDGARGAARRANSSPPACHSTHNGTRAHAAPSGHPDGEGWTTHRQTPILRRWLLVLRHGVWAQLRKRVVRPRDSGAASFSPSAPLVHSSARLRDLNVDARPRSTSPPSRDHPRARPALATATKTTPSSPGDTRSAVSASGPALSQTTREASALYTAPGTADIPRTPAP